jgi:cobalt-zinc-cadmium resistance protein CzcA
MAIKLYGTNASTVIERVEQKIQDINRTLPEGVSIVPYYQQKDIVESGVKHHKPNQTIMRKKDLYQQ